MTKKQGNKTTQKHLINENFSGYGLALDLAKKMRQQGQEMCSKTHTKQHIAKSKEAKK